MNRLLLVLLLAACAAPETPPVEAPSAEAPAAPGPEPQVRTAPLSPRDTARAVLSGSEVFIDYGRPSMRGRTIMGDLVPYGQVWRTGANAATHLHTEADLEIGGTRVPRGTYTLYTLPAEDRWLLIINRQTGQWGTQYDPAQDLARIPLRRSQTAAPVEQFTIDFVPTGAASADLAMEWERTRLTVPIRVVGG